MNKVSAFIAKLWKWEPAWVSKVRAFMARASAFIAKTGENPNFIAFMAHSGVAAYLSSRFPYGVPRMLASGVGAVLAGIKEFWFDLRNEKTPPQTFLDSLLDFVGYMTGLIVGNLVP